MRGPTGVRRPTRQDVRAVKSYFAGRYRKVFGKAPEGCHPAAVSLLWERCGGDVQEIMRAIELAIRDARAAHVGVNLGSVFCRAA